MNADARAFYKNELIIEIREFFKVYSTPQKDCKNICDMAEKQYLVKTECGNSYTVYDSDLEFRFVSKLE